MTSMGGRLCLAAAFAALASLVAACAQPPPQSPARETVVLLPDKAGRSTAVIVMQGDQRVVLDRPYAGAKVGAAGPTPYRSSAQEVEASFGPVLAARPRPPATFTLYFVEGRDELTQASRESLENVFAELAKYPVPDILVVGHTDRVGSDSFNDELSRKRADVIRTVLIGRGLAPENVVAVGRGEREPLVSTADETAEPRNRRVEIIVR